MHSSSLRHSKYAFSNIFQFHIISYSHKIVLIDFKHYYEYFILSRDSPALSTFYTEFDFQERLPSSQLNYVQTQNRFLVFPISSLRHDGIYAM